MRSLSFTTTSCCRFELMAITYDSFSRNFKGVDFDKSSLFLNLDYYRGIGSIDKSMKIARSFFGNVIYNVNKNPNFATAVKWCWRRSFLTPYVFHLEEDWELLSRVDVEDLIDILEGDDPTIVCDRLRNVGGGIEGKQRNKKIVLSPSLFKKNFLKISRFITSSKNPERSIKEHTQLARLKIQKKLKLPQTNAYLFTDSFVKAGAKANLIVKDIGRGWMEKKGITRMNPKGVRWKV